MRAPNISRSKIKGVQAIVLISGDGENAILDMEAFHERLDVGSPSRASASCSRALVSVFFGVDPPRQYFA